MIVGLIALGVFLTGLALITYGAKLISWGGKYLLVISLLSGSGYLAYLNYFQNLSIPFLTATIQPIKKTIENKKPQKPPEDPETIRFREVMKNPNVLTSTIDRAILTPERTTIIIKGKSYSFSIKADKWDDNLIGFKTTRDTYVFFKIKIPIGK